MQVKVTHTIGDLADDLRAIALQTPSTISTTVRDEAKLGNALAKGYAKSSAGAHGKHYPNAFNVEKIGAFSYEYGPDSAKPQGGMSFEQGSRNQPPHLDLAKSADVIATRFGPAVLRNVGDLFWPGG